LPAGRGSARSGLPSAPRRRGGLNPTTSSVDLRKTLGLCSALARGKKGPSMKPAFRPFLVTWILATLLVGGAASPAGAGAAPREFPIPTALSEPWTITPGPDGNIWFTELVGNHIGRITRSGVIKEFPIPTAGSYPYGITTGPDGNLWFTENLGDKIGRITPA